ncbi:MAG: class I SAM-dependent rRNA methyltransferase, partial [Clostridia bacterium]|nr:class I SAM-dependent rRNA methyltransferase [Clostridia bacterium]
MPYEIYLKKNEEKRIIAGHSWVYANEVARIEKKDKNGSLATVYSHDGRYIGKGYINHASKILVLIFIRGNECDDENFYIERIKAANDYRKKLGYDNCYRMVFAEADNLPALIIDKYGDILVMQCLSLGIDQRKKLICDCLVKLFSPKGIYERSDVSVRKKEGLEEVKQVLYGEVPDYCEICENGIKMLVDVKNGQKTGYFLDQKENRFAARKYCQGEVLDCFCNSGGFSLNAATIANSVTACDISKLALKNVNDNAKLNGFKNITTLCGAVFEVLRTFRKEKRL